MIIYSVLSARESKKFTLGITLTEGPCETIGGRREVMEDGANNVLPVGWCQITPSVEIWNGFTTQLEEKDTRQIDTEGRLRLVDSERSEGTEIDFTVASGVFVSTGGPGNLEIHWHNHDRARTQFLADMLLKAWIIFAGQFSGVDLASLLVRGSQTSIQADR